MSGIFVESIIKTPPLLLWSFLLLPIPFLGQKKQWLIVVGFCIWFFVVGILRVDIARFYMSQDPLIQINDQPTTQTVTGYITDAPDVRGSSQRLKVKVGKSLILVTTRAFPAYYYLDQVKITGKLKIPFVSEEFSYKDYLAKDGIYSVMDFPTIERISKEHHYIPSTFMYEKILQIKEVLHRSIDQQFSRPENTIIEGVILGDDKNMPKALKDQFAASGLSHVTAVSGGNTVILISVLVPFLLMFGLWRQQALYVSIAFVWLYIILVGLPSSGVRAAMMGTLFLLAQVLGRQGTSSRIIILAAAVMLILNPLLLFYDVGFQLSFLASLGIIHLKPIIDLCIKLKIPKEKNKKQAVFKKINFFLDIVSVTCAAQLAVLPMLMYSFGNLSLVAPLTNLLILPIISPLMVLGFLSAFLGIFSGFLGWIFYLPCQVLLWYFLILLNFFYHSRAVFSVGNFSWRWVMLCYAGFILLVWYWQKRKPPPLLEY